MGQVPSNKQHVVHNQIESNKNSLDTRETILSTPTISIPPALNIFTQLSTRTRTEDDSPLLTFICPAQPNSLTRSPTHTHTLSLTQKSHPHKTRHTQTRPLDAHKTTRTKNLTHSPTPHTRIWWPHKSMHTHKGNIYEFPVVGDYY
jgi:hypothetical protein